MVFGALPATQMIGLVNGLHAAQVFYDDFEDGSASDGMPIAWHTASGFPGTILDVAHGNFRISATQGSATGLVFAPLSQPLADTTIQALVRLEGAGNDLVGILARASNNQGYIVEIEADGDVFLGIAGAFTQLSTQLRPTQEDIVLRLEVAGNVIKGWAWRAGELMPSEPLLTGTDDGNPLPPGLPGVYFGADTPAQPTRGTAIFRYVLVDDGVVPEPSTVALSSLGGIALASFAFRRRLGRMPR